MPDMISSDILERLKIFDQHYSILFNSLDINEKIYIGNKDNQVCRFCNKDEKDTTFKNVAHAIPEAIGNKKIILYEECDQCNQFFCENIEVHFDKVTKPWRNIAQIKGKKKIPSYVSKDQKSRIDVKEGFEIIERFDSQITTLDEINNQLSIKYEIEPYIPQAVYKTFVKMALSVMPSDELLHFIPAIQWILEPDHTKTFMRPLKVLTTFIPGGRPNIEPIVILFKRKTNTNTYPYSIFVLAFGNMIYQIVVPTLHGVEKNSNTQTIVPKFPSPFEVQSKYGNVKHDILDWSSTGIARDEVLPVTFSYERKEEIAMNIDNLTESK